MLELYLIRHGETDYNRQRRVQGNSDIPLNDLGRQQARCLQERLQGQHFDQIYASDLSRAFETAEIALPEVDIKADVRLREISFGQYEGAFFLKLPEEEQALLQRWNRGPFHERVPDGESNDDLVSRVNDWLAELPTEGRVIAFSHGGTISSILQTVAGRGTSWGFRLGNTSINKISYHRSWTVLDIVNDTAHLAGLD